MKRPETDERSEDLALLYDAHGGEIYRYLLAMTGSREEAEDAMQEVFMKIHRQIHRVRDPRAYLWRTARNEARRSFSRRGRRQSQEVGMEGLEVFPDEANPEAARADRLSLARELRRLPIKQREAVTLMAFEGRSAREAGSCLGISPNTAASRYRLGLARLRKSLRPREESS